MMSQHKNSVSEVERLSSRKRNERAAVYRNTMRVMEADQIGPQYWSLRHIRDDVTVRMMEPEAARTIPLDAESFLVDGAMMTPAEQYEVGECGRAAIGPVDDVVRVAAALLTARKAAPAVAMLERTPDRRRHCTTSATDVYRAPLLIVRHDDKAGITREPTGRFRGNARAAGNDGLSGRRVLA